MLSGLSYLGFQRSATSGVTFTGKSAATGADLPVVFHSASLEELETAVKLAGGAFPSFRDWARP